MEREEAIINRVASSSLKSIDLEDYLDNRPIAAFDLKDVLFQGMILKEKDFRDFVKNNDWSVFDNHNVHIFCSADAVIPTWAYMMLVTKLQKANLVVQGTEDDLEKALIVQAVQKLRAENWQDAKVVIKGCGSIRNTEFAYTEIAKALVPVVSSLLYGEPCSTVPVFKKPRA
ncbi:MAG: DUF2480 family protein [Cyclobacteriaceae bacterium]